jgi:dTDP-4-amino-4,6-dideoxygalactose transaminase
MLEAFERAFAEYVGLPHAVAVSSGTAALHLALRILGVGRGDAVIAPTLTFMGGVAAIDYQGARPVFVDCAPLDWGLDASLLDEAFDLAERSGAPVKAVVPTDLYGQACDIDTIRAVADARGAPVLLDSAEGVGALYRGRHAGHGAVAAAYSFNGNKILTTSGGGMLCSEDKALIDRARYLSTAARQPQPHYEHTEVGYNYRLSNLSAAVGLAQLETIEERVAARRAVFEGYRERLRDVPGFDFAPEAPERRHTRWLTVALIDAAEFGLTPEQLRLALEEENIEARPLWKPMHLQPVFRNALKVGGERAEALFAQGLCLPSGTGMTSADLDRVCNAIRVAHRSSWRPNAASGAR